MRRTFITATVALLVLSAAACGTASNSSSGKSLMACGHWNNIKGDVTAGILTDAELRAKVNEVRSSASSKDVESAATELLAGITANSTSKIESGASRLNAACA